jgi:hypothetical protein
MRHRHRKRDDCGAIMKRRHAAAPDQPARDWLATSINPLTLFSRTEKRFFEVDIVGDHCVLLARDALAGFGRPSLRNAILSGQTLRRKRASTSIVSCAPGQRR